MQLTLTLLSGLALAGTSLAVPEPRALSFTTWPCANCALQGPSSCDQAKQDYQDLTSETCYPLRNGPSQDSIRVNYSVRPDCYVKLYNNSACTGAGPQYENIGTICQLIVEEGRTHFQVICPA